MSAVLIERLEKEIKHYDRRVRDSVHSGSYDRRGADLRELLTEVRDALWIHQWDDTVV